ncbi:Rpn family recombination-promoting nuclease/putative transposase [bacterium]|nr:Rpn family recombination-promoting nuclease/putative transposase [bacterium]MBU1753199.1 Rpn family recombination-promoting nuclease/putative transposase [bacterium]
MEEKRLIRFDWAAKHILRDKSNFDILEGFLTALLEKDIKIINLLESESNRDDETDKFNRVDLLTVDDKGEYIIIEIQNEREVHYLERLLYGTSKLIVENLKLGETYGKIKKVISVSILYFTLGEMLDDYVYYGSTEFRGIHTKSPLILRKKEKETITTIDTTDIYPEYYLIEVEKFENVIQNDLDEWIYFLKNESIKDDFKSKNIKKMQEKLDILKMPLKERKRYERYLMNLASEIDIIEGAREEGKAEGRTEGRTEGKAEGIKEGIKTIAKNLLDVLDNQTISKKTGLTIEEVEALRK